jgi:hypothetical protein
MTNVMGHFISRLTVATKKLGVCANFKNPLIDEYTYSIEDERHCSEEDCLIPIDAYYFRYLSNDRIIKLVLICEEFAPATPAEAELKRTLHNSLCNRLGWGAEIFNRSQTREI